jgi:hypothetical protein
MEINKMSEPIKLQKMEDAETYIEDIRSSAEGQPLGSGLLLSVLLAFPYLPRDDIQGRVR